jgi:superfamily II DNA or RNA helicase
MQRNYMFHPRPYQIECVNSLWDYFVNGGRGNPIAALPTGTGKSVLPPMFMQRALTQFPGQRMIMLTHVKELVEQNYKALLRMWPTAPVGIFSAGLDRKEAYAPIVFGSIQSVKNSIREIGHRDMLWIDEAHLLSPNDSSMYQQVISELRQTNSYMPVVGLSATPFRMGQGRLTDKTYDSNGNEKDPIFTDLVFDITGVSAFNRLIDECYLSPLIPKQTQHVIDVSDVRELNGDYVQSDLADCIKRQNITRLALAEAWQIAHDRQSWIVFGAGIENCETITGILNEMGVGACCVHSKMKGEDRDAYIQAFKDGRFRAIVSNNILTTGFDHPQVDCIVDLRPTTSVVLHVQKYGRGTRPFFHPSYSFDMLRHINHRRDAMLMGGKRNCIASGQLVLTNRGELPIEQVLKSDLLWDGVEWVSHNGVICQGEQDVIEYAGLIATPDHKIWSNNEWRTFNECRRERLPVSIGSIQGIPVKQSDCYTTYGFQKQQKSCLHTMPLPIVQQDTIQRGDQFEIRESGLRRLRSSIKFKQTGFRRSKMASKSLHFSETTMHQSKRTKIPGLRRERNRIQIQQPVFNGSLDNGQHTGLESAFADRQEGQQRTLRTRKFANGTSSCEYEQPAKKPCNKATSFIQNVASRSKIRRQNISRVLSSENVIRGSQASFFQSEFKQTKRIVWDILNAGPRNRFTCQGLIVSNCIVLDFAGNTNRLGPINDPVIPKKKGKGTGEAPIKLCPECGGYNHTTARFCADCNYEFIFKTKIKSEASMAEIIRRNEVEEPNIEIVEIDSMFAYLHSKAGKTDKMRVQYFSGIQSFNVWLGFEPDEKGFVKHMAHNWWKQHSEGECPQSTAEALQRFPECRKTRQLKVDVSTQYPVVKEFLF